MPEETPALPSDAALAKLREKVAADATLSAAIKTAFLSDIEAQNPAILTNLKAAMEGEGQSNETGGAQSE
jgi:hypothetical protein